MEEPSEHEHWKAWFQQHGAKLLLCARQWTRTAADAEDVLQDAFVRFWRHQRKLTAASDPIGLVLTSIRRAALDLARTTDRRTARETATLSDQPEPLFEPLLQDDGRRQTIEAALRRLPPEQREILVMKIWGERTFEEIARELGISPNTAASRYRYALTAMRKELSTADCHGN